MITFTRCAFMAKQACATFSQVVQKITPPIANNFLKFFFALFATLALGVGNAWAETETLASWTFTSSSYPKNKANFSATGGTCKTGSTFYLNGSGSTWNTSAGKGYAFTAVTDITITLKLANPISAGTEITFAADMFYNKASNAPMKGFNVAVSSNGGTYVTTGLNVTSISLSNSSQNKAVVYTAQSDLEKDATIAIKYTQTGKAGAGQGYFNNITITAEQSLPVELYTVSYNSNGGSGTMSSSTGSSITILDCSFTAPNGKKFSKWNTEDDGSGTSYNPGAVVTEDLTLFAIWEDLPKYTVTLKDDESTLQQTTAGEVVVLPSREGCDGYTFAGWTASWTAPQTAWTTTAPTIIAAGEYTPTANVNLYPVYTQTENASGAIASLNEMVKGNTLSDGDKIVIVANGTNVAMYQETISSSYVNKWDCSTLTTATVSDDSKKWWTVTLTDGGFYLGDETNGYLNFSSNNLYCNSTKSVWTLSDLDDGTFKLQSGGRNLSYRSDLETKYWRMGGASYGTNGVVILKLYKYVEGNSSTTSYISVPDCATPDVIVKTLKSIAVSGMTTEYVEGAEFAFDGTCTATYSVTKNDVAQDDETKTVTPTSVSTPDMTTAGEKEVTVTYTENEVTKTATYNINVKAKPKYTITWNSIGVEVETQIVQGAALGELSTVADCPSGKKFMGWTAATEVNSDGSGIVYVKETDIPTGDMTYYAVFAVVEGEEGTPTTATVTVANYATANSWTNSTKYTTMNIDANITATANGGGNTGKYYSGNGTWRFYQNETPSLTIAAAEGYEIQTVKVTYTVDKTGVLTLEGSNVSSGTVCEINAASVTFSVGNTGSVTNGQAQVSAIEVVYASAAKTSDYSLDCTINTNPEWTIETDEISFADKYVGVSYTETFTISASNLTDAIALAIDGSNFTVSPTSIATDAEFPQTVTVTYAPTAVGSHNATLNITSGFTLSKAIALTGSATEATIYTLTALADIKPTDKVIIVGTNASGNYAMSNDKGTSDAPDAVAVEVADNKIATNKTNILWNIAKNGDNLTIYPADQTAKWLYCLANENDGVRVGSNTNKTFILDATSGYLQHTGTSRYLGIYNNSDWRCYTTNTGSSNIADQSFAFYVLPNTDPSILVTPASTDFDVLTVGETTTQEFEITALNITQALNAELTGEGFTKSEIVDNKITITFAPTEVKEYSATLTISAGTEASASVTLTGKGVAAAYSVTYDKNGAEGDAPTDDTKYVADSKVTVAGQGDMTKAGYRFTGWKYGENIYKAGAKFTMPAEDVTFVAQWVEKQKFDAGYWVLVTDASELNADDYVVIAAADYDVAMKSYETGNNCKQVEVTKVNNLLTWNENVGVFQLDKSGENYTFQDVNTEQYLYAAGGTSSNYLKAADKIPADENAKKYTWTISIADNKATIKAQIEDDGDKKAHNWLRYNNTESGKLFSCYDATSSQKDIALYKYQTTYSYTRTITSDNEWGTICLPCASASTTGATFYEVSSLVVGEGLWLDQLADGAQLKAGKPYIFYATDSEITVTYTGAAVANPVPGVNGLTGTFTDIAANTDLVGHYIIAQNKIWQANDQNTLPANRAYIANTVPTTPQAQIPGRRRVCMGENAATGLDNITNGENTTIKVIENGQLIIIRNGEKFNAQGQKL